MSYPSIRSDSQGKREATEYSQRKSILRLTLRIVRPTKLNVDPVEAEVAADDSQKRAETWGNGE